MYRELKDEWSKHRSNYSHQWLSNMIAKKKMVPIDLADVSHASLKRRIAGVVSDDAQLPAIYKDLHLVQAGLTTDRIVASWDNNAKQDFSGLCGSIHELRDLVWVNPATDAELSDWLESGADFDESRTLASFAQTLS